MNHKLVAGVDEAGRGPLAGPVCAAAVILREDIDGLADSKKLSAKKREQLYQQIMEQAHSRHVAFASVTEIDQLNILRATLLAMRRAIDGLNCAPGEVWVDGIHAPQVAVPCFTLVGGDQKMASISAASILAKVTRDRLMVRFATEYPHYGFDQHKGYGTAAHLAALRQHGPCAIHRQSFAPVKNLHQSNVSHV